MAARRGAGIAPHPDSLVRDGFAHRAKFAWVSGFCSGGLHCGSVYLCDGVGLNDTNLEMLQEIAGALKVLQGPWVLGGDWNLTPSVLAGSKWLDMIGGMIVAPDAPTCHSSTYDFVVVDRRLHSSVAGVARLNDAGTNPHWPARLFLHSQAQRQLSRQLIRPDKVQGLLPHGPLPDPAVHEVRPPVSVDQDAIDAGFSSWWHAARCEWASLTGQQPDDTLPRFAWKPVCGPKAKQHAGECAQSAYWRNLSRRVDECAAVLDGKRPGGDTLISSHLLALDCALQQARMDDDDYNNASAILDQIAALAYARDTIAMRRITAIANKKAHQLETHWRNRKLADWRKSLSSSTPGSQAPTRKAFQWIKSQAGWTKSPVGLQEQNDAIPVEDDLGDDLEMGHDTSDCQASGVWTPLTRLPVPLCDQADVEAEANSWAGLWKEGEAYDAACQPFGTAPLPPIRPSDLRLAALSFPIGTGLGADNTAPRAVARLSDKLLRDLCIILIAVELLGSWPAIVKWVLIVLLPKTDGGRRPIGLFPLIIRVWARARTCIARRWEADHPRAGIFGGSGKGAQRAAWESAFRAETAVATGKSYAQSLLDLVKAFELVPHVKIIQAAEKHGFSLWLLRLSLAAYRLARSVGVDGIYSRLVVAVGGITAGSCFATSELRLMLLDVYDSTTTLYKTITFSLYVDDANIAAAGHDLDAAIIVSQATDHAVRIMEEELELKVSISKSVAVATRYSLASMLTRISATGKVKPVRSSKLLGAAAAGGKRRSIKVLAKRLKNFKSKIKKFQSLKRLGVASNQVVRAAGTPAITYGVDLVGMSDTHLQAARSAVATAISSGAGGKCADAVLFAADCGGWHGRPGLRCDRAAHQALGHGVVGGLGASGRPGPGVQCVACPLAGCQGVGLAAGGWPRRRDPGLFVAHCLDDHQPAHLHLRHRRPCRPHQRFAGGCHRAREACYSEVAV